MKFVCELCGMIYNEEQGDPGHGVPAGTAFAALSPDYECPGCGSKKEAFNKTGRQTVTIQNDPDFWHNAKYTDHYDSDR